MPVDVMQLIRSWLNERLFYVECAGFTSHTSSNARKCLKKSKIQNLKNQNLLLGTKQAPYDHCQPMLFSI